ncbi:MAG: hypothetical protein CMM84_09560 [Rhodothermaceae bacterium]|nr:hypothetical protein [Rhodothermaceae bacterium]MBC12229.1 hypothetical protein [Rhodothermaceae bacterium]
MRRPAISPVPSGTFEADLRATREARGLSLDDIQQQTRIPVDVLRRFEAGDLVGDPTFNQVYLKAFLQSYAKAVGLSPSTVTGALADQSAGRYAGALHPDYDPASAPPPPAPEPTPEPALGTPDRTDVGPKPPPAVQALRESAPSPAPAARKPLSPSTRNARVSRPSVPSARRSFDKNWTTILGLFGAFVVILALAFYFLIFRDDSPEADTEQVTTADGQQTPIDSVGVGAAASAGPRLQLPIQVTLTAGGDGLQSFRVTADDNSRRPYWIEVGNSEAFQADSLLVLWGEDPNQDFSEATVEFQGMRFTPPSGRPFQIDRANGQQVLDSLSAAPASAPPPAGPAPTVDPSAVE